MRRSSMTRACLRRQLFSPACRSMQRRSVTDTNGSAGSNKDKGSRESKDSTPPPLTPPPRTRVFLRDHNASGTNNSALSSRGKSADQDLQGTTATTSTTPQLGSPLYGTLEGGTKMDYGPVRPTGLWKVEEVVDAETNTIQFRKIDEIESEIAEQAEGRDDALVPVDDEEKWKHKLMFRHRFKKTPKHLTWKELGQELECLECDIVLDEHRPEERFEIKFTFINKKTGTRDTIWKAKNDVAASEGFVDLLAAVGSSLSRADVFRTIRFDDGVGTTRDITLRKKSRFTSDIQLSFRPAQHYNLYDQTEALRASEEDAMKDGASIWGFHPQLMDPEYRDTDDPEGTYTLTLSAHALSFIMLRCIERLVEQPLKNFYRPSQAVRRAKVQTNEHIGLSHAVKGWLGVEENVYSHLTPIEAIQDHWLGQDAPFTLIAIINKLREMTYLKKKNPEFHSWLSVRKHDTALAVRNVGVKMLGAGASTLFVPQTHNSTVNRLLPKQDRRRLTSSVSVNAMLGMPDESRHISEFKKLTGSEKISPGEVEGSGSSDDKQSPSTRSTGDRK